MNLSEETWLVAPAPRQTAGTWLFRARTGFRHLAALVAVRRQRGRDRAMLRSFSDRELWNLGITRFDIDAIFNGTYRRD